MTERELAFLAIGFSVGAGYALFLVLLTTYMLNTVDTWWGHRQHRAMEAQKMEPPKTEFTDATSDVEVGFHE